MCIILDTNMFGRFNKRDKGKQDKDMEPIWNWLDKENGKIVYSNTKKFEKEWIEKGGMRRKMHVLRQAGQLKLVSCEDVQKKVDELEGKITSDDEHIIALAMIADVKILVSNDKNCKKDFKTLVRGEVYETKSDSYLLRRDTCP